MAERKRTALVTGASAGLGVEYCRQLAQRCEVIIAVARRADRLQVLAQELSGVCEVHCIEADLTTVEGVTRTVEALRQKGPVDYLVNNAGFAPLGQFVETPLHEQRDMLNLHCEATMTLCRAAIPFMCELGGGSIINVSSLGALVPSKGLAVYGATKAFLNYFSQALQAEVAADGIEVQALCPGYIRTEFHDAMVAEGFERERIPTEMWMDPEAVVEASLSALGTGRVVVVPGEGNGELARAVLASQLEDFQNPAV